MSRFWVHQVTNEIAHCTVCTSMYNKYIVFRTLINTHAEISIQATYKSCVQLFCFLNFACLVFLLNWDIDISAFKLIIFYRNKEKQLLTRKLKRSQRNYILIGFLRIEVIIPLNFIKSFWAHDWFAHLKRKKHWNGVQMLIKSFMLRRDFTQISNHMIWNVSFWAPNVCKWYSVFCVLQFILQWIVSFVWCSTSITHILTTKTHVLICAKNNEVRPTNDWITCEHFMWGEMRFPSEIPKLYQYWIVQLNTHAHTQIAKHFFFNFKEKNTNI